MHQVSVFGNSPWEILHNYETDSPFFTSDYPATIEVTDLNTPINRIIPLAPDIAVRIMPDVNLSGSKPDLSFEKHKSLHRTLKRREVVDLNRLIVRCAEDLVLYRDDQHWIETFIAKNRRYRIETVTQQIAHESGALSISTQRVREVTN
jgi:hypothetical protein